MGAEHSLTQHSKTTSLKRQWEKLLPLCEQKKRGINPRKPSTVADLRAQKSTKIHKFGQNTKLPICNSLFACPTLCLKSLSLRCCELISLSLFGVWGKYKMVVWVFWFLGLSFVSREEGQGLRVLESQSLTKERVFLSFHNVFLSQTAWRAD